ncbi:cyclic lactone autoinducer peptide [Paenibacillus sp. F411]|uniref:AgrD family cyclic lactone autoinducer peptide n=1 Tax=Paenibacillus sp. F411 TaxID=2820239 RepID=UPI00326340DB
MKTLTLLSKAKHAAFTATATCLTLLAVFFVQVASPVFIYSGETPEELLNKD